MLTASRNPRPILWTWIVPLTVLLIVGGLVRYFDLSPAFLLANTFAVPDQVMRRVARRLVNNCVFAASQNCNRSYDDEFAQTGAKKGAKVRARLPQQYELTIGAVANPQPLTDRTVDVEITDQSNICFDYDSWHATLFVDDYMERYGNPAVDKLVNNVDDTGLQRMHKKVAKFVGTPGVTPGSTGTLPYAANQPYLNAQARLFEVSVPRPYIGILNANAHAYLTNANSTLFQPQAFIAAMFKNGQFMGDALGIDRWFKTQNTATHTIGALGGTPLVNGPNQTGAAIDADGTGGAVNGYWLEGDKIQFAGVYDLNPLNERTTGQLKCFTVTQDVSPGAGATMSIPIDPAIITAGPFKNCTNAPANNAAITTWGHASSYAGLTIPVGQVYEKNAFALVMADAQLPRGLWVAERISNAKLGVSIRMLKDHDVLSDQSPCRLDTFHGWSAIRQELSLLVVLG